jgi:hypothetical protein
MKFREHFSQKVPGLNLTLFETTLFASLLMMCMIIVADNLTGRDVGSYEQVKMAKLKAEQDLMALRRFGG